MEKSRSNKLYLCVLLALMLPIVQSALHLADEWELKGIEEEHVAPQFSLANWFNGSFQDSMTVYSAQTFGFRTWFVRTRNQIAYSLFNTSHGNNVEFYDEGYISDASHTNAFIGADYTEESAKLLKERLRKLQFLQEKWKQKGIQCVLAVESGKGYFLADILPGRPREGKNTLYKLLSSEAKKRKLNYLDLSDWAYTIGRKSELPIYNRSGIHLTAAGAILTGDTLVSYISHLMNHSLATIEIGNIDWANAPRYAEETDIFDGLNLLTAPPAEAFAYPQFHVTPGAVKPKLLAVADSYYFMWLTTGIIEPVFEDHHFAFYFDELLIHQQASKNCAEIDLLKEIESRDVILISACDANLSELGWGFIESAYALYTDKKNIEKVLGIYENAIRSDATWLKIVEEKAKAKGISVDQMIHEDAVYLWNTERVK
jgi:hypothetical protein